jgi:hypothetical protein
MGGIETGAVCFAKAAPVYTVTAKSETASTPPPQREGCGDQ